MGLQIAKKLKKDKNFISKDAVTKTLENEKKNPVEFRTIELIKSSNTEVKLLLEKPSKKNLLHKVQVSKSVNKVTKKDKLKLRKDNLKQRLQVQKMIKDEEKASKRRKKKVITGDLKPITDTLNDILVQDEKKRHLSEKEVEKVKQTKVKQQMLNDLAIFQQVMKHPQYAKDPFQTISTHVENKMLLEAGMES